MKYFDNKEITIEITNKCGASCVMCPRELMTTNYKTMSNELFEKIVVDAFNSGVELLDLCGYGDVFLDRDLFKKIKFAKSIKKDCKVFISSTGNALLEKYHDDILEYVDILKLSIYGYSKPVYEKMMGGISYDKTMRNLNALIDSNIANNNKLYTIGNYVLMDENQHEKDDWLEYWEPRLSEVYVWLPHNYIYGRNYRDIKNKEQKTCGRPLKGPLNVAADGIAHLCCFDFNKEIVIGDMRNQNIQDVINGKELKRIQQKHLDGDFSDLLCGQCDQTIHDEGVLIYKSNPDRKVGMSNSSMYAYKS